MLPHSKDRSSSDIVFQACISSIIGVLNLFLDADLPYTWREALIVIAKVQGHGPTHACSIQFWVLNFVQEGKLPLHSYSYTQNTVLEDEGIVQEVQRVLSEKLKVGFIKVQDVCDIIASENLQNIFLQLGVHKPRISQSTA